MTPAQRAEVLAELASARLWAAEVRAGALRRAADLSRLRDRVTSGRVRAVLLVAMREAAAVGEAADEALVGAIGQDLAELIADDEENAGRMAGERRVRR